MSSKIKLGIVGDAGVPTGFATVTHNVAGYLQETGEYDIEIIAINFDGRPNSWSSKFKLWPARLGGDFLGVGLVPEFVDKVRPDCFMMFQDFWNIPMYIAQMPDYQKGLFAYYPVDAPNIKGRYLLPLGATTATGCYTKFAVNESVRGAIEAWDEVKENARKNNADIADSFGVQVAAGYDPITRQALPNRTIKVFAKRLSTMRYPEAFEQIPHGVDNKSFFPISKKGARKILGLPINGFFIGNVNRNQSRKRQDLCIRAFSTFAKKYPESKLLLHCVKTDGQGWDLEQLAVYYGVKDQVIFTHNLFPEQSASLEQLNLLYNALDVQVNTGGGEGWGLTSFEGAAARIPQVVPDWSATKEIWEGSGKLIKIISVRHEPGMINTMQSVIDTDHLNEILSELHDNPTLAEEVGQKCLEVTQRPEYKWENVGKKFDAVFKKIAGKAPVGGPVALTTKGQIQMQKMK